MTRALERTLTNKVWATDHGTILKFMPASSWTVHIINLILLLFLNTDLYTKHDRLRGEQDAKELLPRLGIKCPRLLRQEPPFLELEWIDGDTLLDALATTSPERCRELGRAKGEELRRLHEHGSAYLDARCENTLVAGDDLYSIDHELFRSDADRFHMEMDLITLTATAKRLPSTRYSAFLDGLRTGYPGLFDARYSFRTVMSGLCGLGYTLIVDQQPLAVLTVWKNWVHDLRHIAASQ